jgi:hypothetical protein
MPTERNAWEREVSRELGEIKALLAPLPEKMAKQDARICVLEKWQFKSTALVGAVAFVVGKLTGSIDPLVSAFGTIFRH